MARLSQTAQLSRSGNTEETKSKQIFGFFGPNFSKYFPAICLASKEPSSQIVSNNVVAFVGSFWINFPISADIILKMGSGTP